MQLVFPYGRLVAQEPGAELEAVQAQVDSARAAGLQLLAPEAFSLVQRKLAEAQRRLDRGRVEDASRRLAEARRALAELHTVARAGAELFAPMLKARADAVSAGASTLAPRLLARADREGREAGRRFERDRLQAAAPRVRQAESLYRTAELEAIRAELLGGAHGLQAAARQARAAEVAPESFRQAEALLARADRLLTRDRTRRAEARDLAAEAMARYRRSLRLTSLADSLGQGWLRVEDVIARDEAQLRRIADQLGVEVDFDHGWDTTRERLLAGIRELQGAKRDLARKLTEASALSDRLRARVDSLERDLSRLEAREARLSIELRERRDRERTLREVRAIFSPEEAEVLLSEDRLIVRLFGLTFRTGKAEILPAHHALLTKVQRVIEEFPGAPVTVEGHTDSRGRATANRSLSRRRAIAVREYLLAHMPISADRISAEGYGEDRPIASNDSAEGRRRNRRIEIVLDTGGNR